MDVRGHLDLLVLSVLADTGPVHGYGIISALRARSDGAFDLPEGTVYPALHRMEKDGLVLSRWDNASVSFPPSPDTRGLGFNGRDLMGCGVVRSQPG